MDAPVQESTTSSAGHSGYVRAAVLAGVVLVGGLVAGGVALASADWSADGSTGGLTDGIDAVVVDQGGSGGSGVIPAQRGSGRDCPWEGGQAPDATPTQL